jgi:hypothetical protein
MGMGSERKGEGERHRMIQAIAASGQVARERYMRWWIQGKRSPRGGEMLTADNMAALSTGQQPVLAEGGGGCVGDEVRVKNV